MIKRTRKGEQARDEMVKDVNCQLLRDGVALMMRWAAYFEQVPNMIDVTETKVNVVHDRRTPVLGGSNE